MHLNKLIKIKRMLNGTNKKTQKNRIKGKYKNNLEQIYLLMLYANIKTRKRKQMIKNKQKK